MSARFPPPNANKTLIYIIIAIALLSSGAALTFWGSALSGKGVESSSLLIAIGTGVVAGAIASMALAVLRKLDDSDASNTESKLSEIDSHIATTEHKVIEAIGAKSFDLSRNVTVGVSASLRCVTDVEIGDEFQRCFSRQQQITPKTTAIPIDVVGLKLNRFLDDQFDWLRATGSKAEIRLLLQNPDKESFKAICANEGRARQRTLMDIAKTLDRFSSGTVQDNTLISSERGIVCKIRFYDEYQPVTLFRIGDSCCARPRVTTPAGAATRFYEMYDRGDSALHWGVYNKHFEHCWNSANFTVPRATLPHVNAAIQKL